MNRPQFLIIGAMKAGTTSLYRDLLTNPEVFMPAEKEPESLCDDAVVSGSGLRKYLSLFDRARPGQVCAEASTAYSKLPDRPGVPERARRVLGPDLKVIYLVRDPVARIISHHHHAYAYGLIGPDIDRAVREDHRFIAYSKYAMQAEPWIAALGREQVRIVRFEHYIKNRAATVAELSRFIGIEPRPDLVDETRAFNKSDSRPVPRGPWRVLQRSRLYRQLARPLLSPNLRDLLRNAMFPSGPPRPAPPSRDTVELIKELTHEDQLRLQALLQDGSAAAPPAGQNGQGPGTELSCPVSPRRC